MSDTLYYGRIVEAGQPVAGVSGYDRDSVARETAHYANMYGQDGPVVVQMRHGKQRWKTVNL